MTDLYMIENNITDAKKHFRGVNMSLSALLQVSSVAAG